MVYRLSRMLGIVCIVAGLLLGLAMYTADAFGTLGIPVGDSVVAILIVTMASLVLWSLAYRGHPPWMNFFAKVAFGVRMLATCLVHSMNRLLLHLAYSMARHANFFRFFPGSAGSASTYFYNTRFSTDAGTAGLTSADLHENPRTSTTSGRGRWFPVVSVDLRRLVTMPSRASPLVSFFRLVSPAASATSPHARFSLLS